MRQRAHRLIVLVFVFVFNFVVHVLIRIAKFILRESANNTLVVRLFWQNRQNNDRTEQLLSCGEYLNRRDVYYIEIFSTRFVFSNIWNVSINSLLKNKTASNECCFYQLLLMQIKMGIVTHIDRWMYLEI